MTPNDEISIEKTERLQLLKRRAQAVLVQNDLPHPDTPVDALELTKLLEDLRIYQVELELQNEELRSTQQAAEQSRRRYQTLFSQMPLAAVVVDTNGIVEDCNERANILLGERKRFVALDGRLWQQLSGKDRARLHVALRDVGSGESIVLDKLTIGANKIKTAVMDVHLIGLSMDYKLDRRVLLLLVDRSAEIAREQDQRFYSLLLDASDSMIFATDDKGQVLLANQALLKFLGRTWEDVRSHKREDFLPLRMAIMQAESDQKVLQTGHPMTIEEQVAASSSGSGIDFLTRKFPLRNLEGQIYGVGGISTDITHLKDQQRQTLLSEAVFMNSADAIIITDHNTHIIRVNPAFSRQTGFSADSVLGQPTRMLKSGRQDKSIYQAMWQSLADTGHWAGELSNRRADGSYYTIWSNLNVVRDSNGKIVHYIAVQTDVTRLHEAQLALTHQATFDALTGLPNRTLFNDRMAQLMALSHRHHKTFSLLFIDLDRFKEVNDTLGHQVGDSLLQIIAQRLREGVRTEDTVARIGGDEFVVLLPNTELAGAQAVANNLLTRLREPVLLEQTLAYRPMASLGMAMFPKDGETPDLLLRNADLAMYGAKLSGRNRIASYTPQMSHNSDHAFAIQTELAEAIEQGQLRVYFQPKCSMDTDELMGAEALVRWQRPGHGLVLPGEFIGVAEKCGLLVALDQWVMNEALHQLGLWMAAGLWRAPWRLAVNQNVADLNHPDMLTRLQKQLQTHQVSATALELEITEDALLQHTPAQLARLGELNNMGISLAIDDFGTGYSSLAYLRELPVSVIKIDLSFVKTMLVNENDAILVRTIVDLAHNLGHTLVAEGVEEPRQQACLTAMGCELGQGYLFGKPINADEFAARWLVTSRQP